MEAIAKKLMAAYSEIAALIEHRQRLSRHKKNQENTQNLVTTNDSLEVAIESLEGFLEAEEHEIANGLQVAPFYRKEDFNVKHPIQKGIRTVTEVFEELNQLVEDGKLSESILESRHFLTLKLSMNMVRLNMWKIKELTQELKISDENCEPREWGAEDDLPF